MTISLSVTPRTVSAVAGIVSAAANTMASSFLSIRLSLLERIDVPHRNSKRARPVIDFGWDRAVSHVGDMELAEAKLSADRRQYQKIRQAGLQPTGGAGADGPSI